MANFFFEDEEVQDIAESHINQIGDLEEEEAKRILKLYKRVRHELRDRLDMLPGGDFTSQKLQGALLQVDLAINEMNRMLNKEMTAAGELAATQGIEDLIKELGKFNKKFTGAVVPISLDAVRIGADTNNLLINKREASLQAYSQSMRSMFSQKLSEATVAQTGTSEVVAQMSKIFIGEEWRLHRIVRTELHNIYGLGKLTGMRESLDVMPDLKKTLFHPMDSRTGKDSVRLSQNNPIVDIDEPFIEYSTGKRLEYMAPPNRPNDRAILIPYRAGWKA